MFPRGTRAESKAPVPQLGLRGEGRKLLLGPEDRMAPTLEGCTQPMPALEGLPLIPLPAAPTLVALGWSALCINCVDTEAVQDMTLQTGPFDTLMVLS